MNRLLMKTAAKLSRKPQVTIHLQKLEGFVLDVGAGGEGTIAKACGNQTICVDISKGEISEATSRGAVANWILCDACSMPFTNNSFSIATFFFSLMYVKTPERKRAVLAEVKRVLKSGGKLYLWDAITKEEPDLNVVFVEAILPNEEKICTGYGVKGKKEKEQNLELISKLALDAGFHPVRTESHKNWFAGSFSTDTETSKAKQEPRNPNC